MNAQSRWMAFVSIHAVLLLKMSATYAFTDGNADIKEAAADRAVAPVVAQAVPVRPHAAWVPLSVKSLEGFRPVFPQERVAMARSQATLVAQAGVPASAARR